MTGEIRSGSREEVTIGGRSYSAGIVESKDVIEIAVRGDQHLIRRANTVTRGDKEMQIGNVARSDFARGFVLITVAKNGDAPTE